MITNKSLFVASSWSLLYLHKVTYLQPHKKRFFKFIMAGTLIVYH